MADGLSSTPGYYGKIPVRGDFVRRRLPRGFLDPWDLWLQGSIAISKEELAIDWLDGYLTSPIWRFALSAGVCGEFVSTGVFMPSVDSVGRYYPMTISILLPAGCRPIEIGVRNDAWFSEAEDTALYCLEDDFTLEEFDKRLEMLGRPSAIESTDSTSIESVILRSETGQGWRITNGYPDNFPAGVCPSILDSFIRARYDPYSLWWTTGSDDVKPSLLIYRGLPPSGDFAAFLCAPSN